MKPTDTKWEVHEYEGTRMTEKIKPARVRIGCASTSIRPQRYSNRDPWPQVPFTHELTTPPKMWHVWAFVVGVLAIYVVIAVLGSRLLGWMP